MAGSTRGQAGNNMGQRGAGGDPKKYSCRPKPWHFPSKSKGCSPQRAAPRRDFISSGTSLQANRPLIDGA